MQNSNNDAKIGKAIVSIRWYAFLLKMFITVSIIALVILHLLSKPLWIAPVIGLCACVVYRLIWVVIGLILGKFLG